MVSCRDCQNPSAPINISFPLTLSHRNPIPNQKHSVQPESLHIAFQTVAISTECKVFSLSNLKCVSESYVYCMYTSVTWVKTDLTGGWGRWWNYWDIHWLAITQSLSAEIFKMTQYCWFYQLAMLLTIVVIFVPNQLCSMIKILHHCFYCMPHYDINLM